jgi:CBS domain-containing protein
MQIPTEWEESYPDERSLRVSILHESLSALDLRPPICVLPDTSAGDAVRLMNDERIGALLILEEGRLRGVFTERDVLQKIVGTGLPLDTPVRQLMTESPTCLRQDDAIVFALKVMHEGGFRHIPLLDKQGRPVAIVSVKDVVEFVVGLFAKEVVTAPPDSSHFRPASSEGA